MDINKWYNMTNRVYERFKFICMNMSVIIVNSLVRVNKKCTKSIGYMNTSIEIG